MIEQCPAHREAERGSAVRWDDRYLSGDIPWDTGIVPPEVVSLVGSGIVKVGWALDLGCGSGLSSRFLARNGFRVIGVDLAQSALARGNRAARREDVGAWFCRADVTNLAFLRIGATLAVDVGCLHAIPADRRGLYITTLAELLLPGAYYLVYAFEPTHGPGAEATGDDSPGGIGPAEVAAFAPLFSLRWAQHGRDGERPSAWYLMQRQKTAI